MLENYSPLARRALGKLRIGERIRIEKKRTSYEGMLMPRIEAGDRSCIVLKLDNGYNLGIRVEKGVKILKSKKKEPEEIKEEAKFELGKWHAEARKKAKFNPKKPTIAILGTGGTIASRVDYTTGGVVPVSTAEDIVAAIPELADIANLRCRVLFEMFSEDMTFSHYSMIAKEVAKEIKKGCDGVIITHGTDTMGYTAAALSFALQDLPVPVILVGAQRSSDRGSSDAAMNMICAARFIVGSDWSGVGICMHGSMSDDYCLVHEGTKARKMHTSRRDAFESVNVYPFARIEYNGKIEFIRKDYRKKDKKRKLKVRAKFEPDVALVKMYPGIEPKVLKAYKEYKGIVLEGTGLGHAPVTSTDKHTIRSKKIFEELKKLAKRKVIVMTSQCIDGRINMNVYASGRRLQEIGVVPGEDMLPETAFIKLSWLLANEKKNAKKLMRTSIAGEIRARSEL
ncbi:MAG: Glu-tRNA(Gln) amidotransferase subunit GatD [Candidatus Aenigmatarchaeota archaeon]